MTVFQRLPIDADEGFPQAFRLVFAGRDYRFRLYANIAEEVLAAADGPLDLPSDRAFLVLAVDREEIGGTVPILRRKLVPGIVYAAHELVLTFVTLRLDPRNLNAAGAFGSSVVGGVASADPAGAGGAAA
ncbi:hypothetical protein [Actinomadura rupiterrae]|uniref:hypothetical protein n=1 Tax=Actinomadura rupiterrae TaxID=559627 RepID=UPI0020A4E504|nr:hypothetical protein [Actinomadura rupiterrae]MCP2341339.1 hypothetical protein [Actinomadura rupiterrae]